MAQPGLDLLEIRPLETSDLESLLGDAPACARHTRDRDRSHGSWVTSQSVAMCEEAYIASERDRCGLLDTFYPPPLSATIYPVYRVASSVEACTVRWCRLAESMHSFSQVLAMYDEDRPSPTARRLFVRSPYRRDRTGRVCEARYRSACREMGDWHRCPTHFSPVWVRT